MAKYTIDNKYRAGGSLTPEGAVAGLRDLLNEVAFITTCEQGSRPLANAQTKDEIVGLARQAQTHFEQVEEINRALCAQPFPEPEDGDQPPSGYPGRPHNALAHLVNIVPGLYAFAKAETEIARERAQQALLKDAGLA